MHFFKYHSSGNDFIIFDNREDKIKLSSLDIQKLCSRRFSIGADGLVLLQKSSFFDYYMIIYNSDGSEACMCGNALLCFTRFIYDFINKKPFYNIQTKAGNYKTFVKKDRVYLQSNLPQLYKEKNICINKKKYKIGFLNSGVMHGVLQLKDIDNLDVFKMGKLIRFHKSFAPEGINVNFCQVIDNKQIKIRVYEKGVENETYSCSTGALAIAYFFHKTLGFQKDLTLFFKGGKTKISIENTHIILCTKPSMAFQGVFSL